MTILFGLGKKAQIENYFAVVAVLFTTSLCFIISMLILYYFVASFTATGVCMDGAVNNCLQASNGFLSFLALWDNIIILVVIALLIAIGLTSYKLPASAAFLILSILMSPFLAYVSYFFNYVFSQIVSQAEFDVVRAFYPKTILVCTNFHWIALVAFVVGSVTLYAKREKGQYVE